MKRAPAGEGAAAAVAAGGGVVAVAAGAVLARAAFVLLLTAAMLTARAADFPAPQLVKDLHSSESLGDALGGSLSGSLSDNLGDYRARAAAGGIRLLWDGARFTDAADNRYTPPAWFTQGYPREQLDGLMHGDGLDDNAIGRLLRAGASDSEGATRGWQKLVFVALELPQGGGDFQTRLQRLQTLVNSSALPNLRAARWTTLSDARALRTAVEESPGDGGIVLRHVESDYYADEAELLLLLPYQVGEAVVAAHRDGKGEYAGMLGSMEVTDDGGGEFILATGFNRSERRNPPKIGARVQYKFKGYTATGKPKNPVFLKALKSRPPQTKIGGIIGTAQLMWLFIFCMALLAALDAATHAKKGGRRWNFKSAIVSTGLLGTFVGIFWGLYNFNTSDIAAGVPALLEGLKLSFITSIVGIALSTLLSVWQTICGTAD